MKQLPRINYQIREKTIKLIDEKGDMIGECHIGEARRLARERKLDLVEVAPNARPPVVKLMNFGRYLYEKKRQERESRKHQHRTEVREMRMTLKISEHDYQVKLAKIKEFLMDGDRVKVRLRLRGRENLHADLAMKIFDRLIVDLKDIAKEESEPKQEESIIQVAFLPEKKKG
ncbi:translation initiation factor IF-3 [candidate division TA06 bacterium DG_78]|uniref:Translation initiation factor IF-3 n=1 Tax=candidate division TA06 bacterium DG_78 TaxID=1703772 RepID=A0A0S7YDJ4_UNCT6|nr:MAG: translation initiation factor IF-3 [candidate division TA06 bacterium DG_78]